MVFPHRLHPAQRGIVHVLRAVRFFLRLGIVVRWEKNIIGIAGDKLLLCHRLPLPVTRQSLGVLPACRSDDVIEHTARSAVGRHDRDQRHRLALFLQRHFVQPRLKRNEFFIHQGDEIVAPLRFPQAVGDQVNCRANIVDAARRPRNYDGDSQIAQGLHFLHRDPVLHDDKIRLKRRHPFHRRIAFDGIRNLLRQRRDIGVTGIDKILIYGDHAIRLDQPQDDLIRPRRKGQHPLWYRRNANRIPPGVNDFIRTRR